MKLKVSKIKNQNLISHACHASTTRLAHKHCVPHICQLFIHLLFYTLLQPSACCASLICITHSLSVKRTHPACCAIPLRAAQIFPSWSSCSVNLFRRSFSFFFCQEVGSYFYFLSFYKFLPSFSIYLLSLSF